MKTFDYSVRLASWLAAKVSLLLMHTQDTWLARRGPKQQGCRQVNTLVRADSKSTPEANGKRSRRSAGAQQGCPDSIRTHLKSTAQARAGQGASVKVEEERGATARLTHISHVVPFRVWVP